MDRQETTKFVFFFFTYMYCQESISTSPDWFPGPGHCAKKALLLAILRGLRKNHGPT